MPALALPRKVSTFVCSAQHMGNKWCGLSWTDCISSLLFAAKGKNTPLSDGLRSIAMLHRNLCSQSTIRLLGPLILLSILDGHCHPWTMTGQRFATTSLKLVSNGSNSCAPSCAKVAWPHASVACSTRPLYKWSSCMAARHGLSPMHCYQHCAVSIIGWPAASLGWQRSTIDRWIHGSTRPSKMLWTPQGFGHLSPISMCAKTSLLRQLQPTLLDLCLEAKRQSRLSSRIHTWTQKGYVGKFS